MNSKQIDVTKIFTFDSAHHLDNYEGSCKNLHGHTYRLEVTVRGIQDERGIVIDFYDLKKIVQEKVLDYLDHKYLNEIFEFNTTCENILVWIFGQLDSELSKEQYVLHKILLWETPTSYAALKRKHFHAEG